MGEELEGVRFVTSSLDADIYLGFWINRSVHWIEGATLTLDHRTGALLIALVALFVNASGRGLWKLTRCVLHFRGSSQARPDALYLQGQATLRNSNLALDAFFAFLDIWRVWRNRIRNGNRRLLGTASIALMVAVAFTLAGIFSSRVFQGWNEVLISGPKDDCNVHLPGANLIRSENRTIQEYIAPFLSQKSAEYLAYAQRCYQAEKRNSQQEDGYEHYGHLSEKEKKELFPDDCGILSIPTLPYRTRRNAPCPFKNVTCKLQDANIIIETDRLDGYKDLGLNQGPPVTMQVRHHCGPLNITAKHEGDMLRYYLGARHENMTFEIKEDTTTSATGHRSNYVVYAVSQHENGSLYGEHIPWIEDFTVTNMATTMLFLVSTSINYVSKTDDPWFLANNTDAQGLVYVSNDIVSVVGCTTRREYCNPKKEGPNNCVQVYSDYTEQERDFEAAWDNPEHRKHLRALVMTLHQFGAQSIGAFFEARNVPNLLARQTLRLPPVTFKPAYANQTKALPSDQWQDEMVYLSQANFAAMQHSLVDYARGSWLGGDLCDRGECERLCYNQRVRSSRHYSVSVLGLSIILIVGGIIQSLALFLDSLLAFLFSFRRFYGYGDDDYDYAYAEWQAGSLLQLQRLAQEGVGAGKWSRATDLVPVTAPGDALAVLDVSKRDHPRLSLRSHELTHVALSPFDQMGSSTHYQRIQEDEHW
ncbi:uncharacterized protein M421DRAFT_94681 [Didymella exigua CBS 183.55]|uniref:Uncharacterized protein n=1 Tax=Didymella exigua CBS 183.55 TaxID=1150837 RepID=A0A6A5RFX0_9PLEO|nr:uncharacterized protein M421DRAFT_94681 [Didymella exigua CBS 183.55]KAF1925396.1 hypothetical protein M421DRAFT_94681 [Didymella exigua CBS 183.55]